MSKRLLAPRQANTFRLVTVPNIGVGVPVTAKLSKKFYETLGEDVANEMVDWFNAVDATYRSELRELNESNFARFDAKVEQRFAQLDAKWESRWTQLDAKWESRWTELDTKLERRLAEFKAEISQQLAKLETGLVRWMFTFWMTTALAIVALLIRR